LTKDRIPLYGEPDDAAVDVLLRNEGVDDRMIELAVALKVARVIALSSAKVSGLPI